VWAISARLFDNVIIVAASPFRFSPATEAAIEGSPLPHAAIAEALLASGCILADPACASTTTRSSPSLKVMTLSTEVLMKAGDHPTNLPDLFVQRKRFNLTP
jgi:hypothetical protein